MLIESITIEGLGKFQEPVTLGLQPGLNILAQPNEWGKSTVVHALCRALFDKYSSQTEEIRQLRPAGTSLSPQIELCFAAKGERYRLRKRFLDGKMSELQRWDGHSYLRTDEADKADQRVRELLGAPLLESRKNHPETWGLIRYLWCRQDEPAEWPCWEGDCGEATRSKLATVEIDTLAGALAARLQCRAEEHFTTQGRVKKGSALQLAESSWQEAEAELQRLRQRRADLAELERQHRAAVTDIPQLERERTARTDEAKSLRAEAERAEKLTREIALAESELKRADEALQTLRLERDTLAQIEVDLRALGEAQAQSLQHIGAHEVLVERAEKALLETKASLEESQSARAAGQLQLQRARALMQAQKHVGEIQTWQALQTLVAASNAQIEDCEKRLTQLPHLSDIELKNGRKLEREAGDLRVRLQAAGLVVEVRPLATATIQLAADGQRSPLQRVEGSETVRWRAVRALDLELGGWGRIVITSGATEAAQLQADTLAAETKLAAWLAAVGVKTLSAAEAAVEEARAWRAKVEIGRAQLAAHLAQWKTPGALASALRQAQHAVQRLREQQSLTADEEAQTTVSWEVEEAKLLAADKHMQTAMGKLELEVESSRGSVEKLRLHASKIAQEQAVAQGRARALQEQREAIIARHPTGLGSALQTAQVQYTRADARLVTQRCELPPAVEKLREQALRAIRAATEVDGELVARQRESERLRTLLEERGGEELFAREEEALTRKETARARATELRREGLAARLLRQLIERREQRSIRAVLRPLEERLTHAFAALTGEQGRRVWFDEHLAVKGVGARENELIRFEDLSRGAREQLLLALRAAIALEVTETEGTQCLVLDDVLVHTDARRHENVLDYLQELSSQVQILLLTCHADRYRGLGQVVPVGFGRVEP